MAITTMELKRAMIEQQRTTLELRARLTKTEKEHVQKDNIIQRLLRRETEVILRGQEWRFRAETAEARLAEVEAQRDKLAGIVRMLIGCIEDLKRYENPDDFEEEIDAARHALAKLEASDGK
jgi:hypothetical protein